MKIAIRMDDITPDMDWQKFLHFKEMCDEINIKPLIGVVPDNKDPMLSIDEKRSDFWQYILELQRQGWTIAQHGVDHVYKTKKKGCFPLNALSEFAGLPYQSQFETLKYGKDMLESYGIKTNMFMAPAHSYDKNTLKALKSLGFSKITDGFGTTPYKWNDMTFYPISFKQSKSLKQRNGYTTFVVHANTMDDKDFDRYRDMLTEYKDMFISYNEYLDIIPVKKGIFGRMYEYTLASLKYYLVRLKSAVRGA